MVYQNKYLNSFLDYIKRLDKILFLTIVLISSFSLVILKSVSRAMNGDYFKTQLVALLIGLFLAFVVTNIDYLTISNNWILIGGFSVFIMIFTLFFGVQIIGGGGVDATAWLKIGGMTFQTSELVKICFLITFSKHIDMVKGKNMLNKPLQVLILSVHGVIPVLLCHLQGDDGAGIVFFVMFLFMCYSSGLQMRYFIILGALVIIAIPIIWEYVLNEYQKLRFSAVYNLDDPYVASHDGYQQYQARISIGSGGLFGHGLFNGPRVETNLVTFQHSDFIFSVVGEELGFVGCGVVMASLLLLMWRIMYVAKKARDNLGKTICFGLLGLVFVQTICNIGMCLALLPVIGITLPFYSAGGSSVICLLLGLGLVECVYMRKEYIGGVRLRYKETHELGYKELKDM